MQLAWCWTNLMRLRYRRDGSIWVKAPFVRELPISYTEPQASKVSVRAAKNRHHAAFPTATSLGLADESPPAVSRNRVRDQSTRILRQPSGSSARNAAPGRWPQTRGGEENVA